ncbi:hypothetical protein AURANDRAFT_62435 [Aureococcus anophagefferens]|uniref:Methyltransferase type 12 domain-containing protein n=1 Tax=Aureococcus anophagefferens TaxID=44056 RepID=F0Y3I2_AURAN|nr:hypothetical protein AURANDRAFT_62435 [Aureococcus anophagefferens]EGB09954.1 hypothetical protein AURANDRAFT_62435 [Aureococcus anophagefferens]|eukprot:XP_009034807.1 hypothetical protein AURANDRAFT_62435 [Aureococcus anophagefferens]
MRIALLLVAATALRAPARHSATRASVATTRRGGAAAVANATTTTLRGGAIDDKIAAAIDACRAALEKRANNTKAAAALATLLRQTGDEDGALAALARAAAHGDAASAARWAVALEDRGDDAGEAWRLAWAHSGDVEAFQRFVGYELRAKRFARARAVVEARLAAEPTCAAALELRATERRAAGDAAEAARLYAEAADVAKRTGGDAAGAALRCALGRAGAGELGAAAAAFQEALQLDAERAEIWRELAFFLDEQRGDRAGAVAALKRAVDLDAGEGQGRTRERNSQLQRLRSRPFSTREGQARAQLAKWTDGDEDWRRAPLDASYVSGLFDQFAKTFEQKLVGDLSYRGHLQCAGLLARSLPKRPGVVAVDVGAGTGLCGAALRDALPIEEIVGVDVSPRMLDAAREKGVYEDLVVSDGAAYLATRGPGSVDVLVAADVFAYVGDCAELFSAARRVLKADGRFAFTLEERASGFGLGDGGRFAHSEAYLRDAAAAAGLAVIDVERAVMRTQRGADVNVLVVALAPAVEVRDAAWLETAE